LADANVRLDAAPVDYALLALYFVLVLGIGVLARRQVSTSLDFFLSGRSMPAWVTGLAFVSANLGAIEVMGMSANGAEYGMPTAHYFWIGAVPAMLFLGIVMMPFYYGSKVRSVPEFMRRRFGRPAHLLSGVSFAAAQVLIAGANLFLLAKVINLLLGWPIWVSVLLAAIIVLIYTTIGGLSAAIYNEVLQFFVIIAALLPLTIVGLYKVGGWEGLVDKVGASPGGDSQMSSWPGNELTGFSSNFLSALGLVFGLGFVLSFGYWTTNFVEVQRAMASKSMSAAKRTPIIGAFPKIFIPFIVIIPGMVAAVTVTELAGPNKLALVNGESAPSGADFNDALLLLMRDLLPNGILGIAIAGLLASFMAGMAANISSFNTVFTYDIWQAYVSKDRSDGYYLRVGRLVTVIATILAIGAAFFAATYANLMDYLQELFSFFNAPLFATFILGMFWKRMTPHAGWSGLATGTVAAVTVSVLAQTGVLDLPGQGASFVGAIAAFVVDIVVSVVVSYCTRPLPAEQLHGLVYSLTPKESLRHATTGADRGWYRSPGLLAGIALVITIALNFIF